MSYPAEPPTTKHDLFSPRLPPDGSRLQDAFGFSNTAALFQALEKDMPADLRLLGPVYSYRDAPDPPLSKHLCVIGVANSSLSVVRKLVGDNDAEVPQCLHRCVISVKRADAQYRSQLQEKDVINSKAFSQFMRCLKKQGLVAILGRDKYERFTILMPSEQLDPNNTTYQEEDFVSVLYVGKVKEVKQFLTHGISKAQMQASQAAQENDGDLWQPPGSTTMTSDEDLWRPPGAENGNTDDFSWQPPPNQGDDAFGDFGSTGDGSWQPDVQSVGTKRKRQDGDNGQEGGYHMGTKRMCQDDDNGQEGAYHADPDAQVAADFYDNLTRSLDTRADSRLFHMRSFNGWVKAVQIQELDPKTTTKGRAPLRVLDLACGKGGDLGKWAKHKRTVNNYVGIDVARKSLRDGAIRARDMRSSFPRCTFTCADLGADVPGRLKSANHRKMQRLMTWSLQNEPEYESGKPEFKMLRGGGITQEDKFDVVSIQFAIHYMMSTRKRARRFFQTVSELLEIGGNMIATTIDAQVVVGHLMNLGLDLHFNGESAEAEEALIEVGGGACRLRFAPEIVKRIFASVSDGDENGEDMFGLKYTFTLVEGSDHAAGVGDAVNLPEWLTPMPVLKSLAEEAGLELEYVQNFHEFFATRADPTVHANAHSSLYKMKVLNRNGSISDEEWEISRLYAAIKFRKVRESTSMKIDESDKEDSGEEEDEEEKIELDPATKGRLMPMAMAEAKKAAGDDVWKSLSSNEKKLLTENEVKKLARKS